MTSANPGAPPTAYLPGVPAFTIAATWAGDFESPIRGITQNPHTSPQKCGSSVHHSVGFGAVRSCTSERIRLRRLIFRAAAGGGRGIRTPEGLLTPTRFPGVRLKPLIHPSEGAKYTAPPCPRACATR